jgi:hypothetical protein
MYVCMYVCMFISQVADEGTQGICACMHVTMYVCMYVDESGYEPKHVHVYMYVFVSGCVLTVDYCVATTCALVQKI